MHLLKIRRINKSRDVLSSLLWLNVASQLEIRCYSRIWITTILFYKVVYLGKFKKYALRVALYINIFDKLQLFFIVDYYTYNRPIDKDLLSK